LLIANDKGGTGHRETGAGIPQPLKLTDTPSRADGKQWQWWRLVCWGSPELGKCLANLNLNQCKSFWPNRSQLFKWNVAFNNYVSGGGKWRP